MPSARGAMEFLLVNASTISVATVSYTHLDVYKRQVLSIPPPPRSVKGCFAQKSPGGGQLPQPGPCFLPVAHFSALSGIFGFPCFGSRTCRKPSFIFSSAQTSRPWGSPSQAQEPARLFSPVLLSLPVPAFFPALLSLQDVYKRQAYMKKPSATSRR